MAQRAEIDLNSEDGGFAFRQWGMSISFRLRNNQIRQTQFPTGLPKENAPIWQPQHRKPKLARAYAETTLMAMVAHRAINLSSSCDHLLGDDGYDPAPGDCLTSLLSLGAPCRSQACLRAFHNRAGASGTISDLSPCYRRRAADVQFFDVVGSRSKRSSCASDDEADARRQKRPARS